MVGSDLESFPLGASFGELGVPQAEAEMRTSLLAPPMSSCWDPPILATLSSTSLIPFGLGPEGLKCL